MVNFILFVLLFLLTFRVLCQLESKESSFSLGDCDKISTRGYCKCTYNVFETAVIDCSDTEQTARIRITVHDADVVTIDCEGRIGVGCNYTHPCLPKELLERLPPHLGALRRASFIVIRYCLPFTQILSQLHLREIINLQVFGLEFINLLRLEHFGENLNLFHNISSVELFAQSAQHLHDKQSMMLMEKLTQRGLPVVQQLNVQLLSAFSQLRSLTIDMNYAQLPYEIFTPVARTLKELYLLGRLRNIPREALVPINDLQLFTMAGHQLDARLREHDFVSLPTLKELCLQRCNISALPMHIFAPLTELERLSLAQNNLRALPSALLRQQRNLIILNIMDNQLEALPDDLLAHTTKLQQLLLTFNRLRQLSANLVPPRNALDTLYVDVNELRVIEAGAFRNARHLRSVLLGENALDWKSNEACTVLEGLNSLEMIGLQNNSLHYICDQLVDYLPKLQLLSLNHNKLTRLSAQLLRSLNESASLRSIYLGDNPWVCDCGAGELHAFVRSNRVRFPAVHEMTCNDSRKARLIELAYNDFCLPDLGVNAEWVLKFTIISILSLLLISATLCYYKYKLQLKIWLYAHGLCLRCISEAELDRDRKYDAFISYAHEDEHFVERELVPGLEQGVPAFKACIHARDWLVGAFIPEQIIDSVEQSRRTIIVLSKHFMQSEWALMEFRMAHQSALNEGRSRIILVVYGDLEISDQLDQELCAYLKLNTYLKWGEPWFWKKLRYAMPHTRLIWERAQRAERRANATPLEVMSTRSEKALTR